MVNLLLDCEPLARPGVPNVKDFGPPQRGHASGHALNHGSDVIAINKIRGGPPPRHGIAIDNDTSNQPGKTVCRRVGRRVAV